LCKERIDFVAPLPFFAGANRIDPVPGTFTTIWTALHNRYRYDCGFSDFGNPAETGNPVEKPDQGWVLIEFFACYRSRKMCRSVVDTRLPKPHYRARSRSVKTILLFLLTGLAIPSGAAELICPQGVAVLADLGEGVIMRTCMWEKSANVTVRAGPLELVKNGVLILRLETDSNGKLHGRFTSWNDAGEVTENGNYHEGLKEGIWTVTNNNGDSETVHYRAGAIVGP
jgi:hypothetical protein